MNNNDYSNYEDLGLREAQLIMTSILKDIAAICDKHSIRYFLDAGTLIGAVRHKGFIPWDDDIDIGMLREDYIKFLSVIKEELPEHLFLQTHENEPSYNIYQVPCKIRYNNTLFIEEKIAENENMHNGLFVDILPYDSLPKKMYVYKIQRKISNFVLKSFIRLREKPERLTLKNKVSYFIYAIIVMIFKTKTRLKLFDFLISWNDKNSEYMGYGLDTVWSQYIYKKKDFFDLIKVEFEGEHFNAPRNYDAVLTALYGDYMTLPKEEDRVWHAKIIKKLKSSI